MHNHHQNQISDVPDNMVGEPTNTSSGAAASLQQNSDDNRDGVFQLVRQWWSDYKQLAGTTVELVMADAKLAASSVVQMIALSILAAFSIIAAWASLMSLIGYALMQLGAGFVLVAMFMLFAHLIALTFVIFRASKASTGLSFAASKQAIIHNSEPDSHEPPLSK